MRCMVASTRDRDEVTSRACCFRPHVFPVISPGLAVVWRHGPPLPVARPRTLAELVTSCQERHGDAIVLDDGRQLISWNNLVTWSGRLASRWRDRVAPGERVAILVGNGLPHLLAELAAWRLGAVAVPIFSGIGLLRVSELLHAVEPALIVADGGSALASGMPGISSDEVMSEAFSPGPGFARPVSADTPCLILFTSGSSGRARGVILSHDNLCSQQAAFAQVWPDVGPGDRLASYLPWHHSFGALAERLWALTRGATMTLVPGGGRDHHRLVTTVRRVRPTVVMSVPKIHRLFSDGDALDFSVLRWVFTAGAPLPEAIAERYAQRGVAVYEGWGLTETSPSAAITPAGRVRMPGVVGEPIPGVAIGVRADGRILVRGPNVMLGYWRDEAATAACCTRDGDQRVIDSGDLGGWTPAGLRLDGRADHQVKLPNGEKVTSAVIEAALHEHPAVAHAVVCAEPDLVALIEAAPGHCPRAVASAIAAVNAAEPVPYRRIGEAFLITDPLCVERGQLTASLKVARAEVIAQFRGWRRGGGGPFAALPFPI